MGNKGLVEYFLVALALMCMSSCTLRSYSTTNDYRTYIEDPRNGLMLSKTVGEVELSAKYLPPAYRVLQEIETKTARVGVDSLLYEYSQSIMFNFSITPTAKCRVKDLKYFNVTTEEQYKEFQSILNYQMNDYFSLKIDQHIYHPQICHLEQDYGISGKLNFYLIFVPENLRDREMMISTKNLTLIFEDSYFNTDVSEFVFASKVFKSLPTIDN